MATNNNNTTTIQRRRSKEGADSLDDARFKNFLQNADEIESIEHFQYWKDDFLRTFRQYLNPLGTATAREADEDLYFELEKLAKVCLATKTLVREGKISPEASSVTGQKAMNEMTETMKSCEESIDAYFPKTKSLEQKCGYTKFELAAVLVRDGFRVYGLMCATRDYLAGLVSEGGLLAEVLKPNQLSIVMYYFRCLESFMETMADLGMYKLMEQCVEIYKIRPRGKKKKSKKFRKGGDKDALSDTTVEDVRNGGRMFENKTKAGQKTKAIMDKGWSNGFMPGEEIKGPVDTIMDHNNGSVGGGEGTTSTNNNNNNAKTKKKSKKDKDKKHKDKDKKGKLSSTSNPKRSGLDSAAVGGSGGNGNGIDGINDDDDDENAVGPNADGSSNGRGGGGGDAKDPSYRSKSKSKSRGTGTGDDNDNDNDTYGDDKDGDNDDDSETNDPSSTARDKDKDGTETTDDDDDEGSSSSEEEEDDDDEDEEYIYYFDPVRKVVGKLSRASCLDEKLILSKDEDGTEIADGVVEDWDARDEDTPGKTELVTTLKEILRGEARDKVGGLD